MKRKQRLAKANRELREASERAARRPHVQGKSMDYLEYVENGNRDICFGRTNCREHALYALFNTPPGKCRVVRHVSGVFIAFKDSCGRVRYPEEM